MPRMNGARGSVDIPCKVCLMIVQNIYAVDLICLVLADDKISQSVASYSAFYIVCLLVFLARKKKPRKLLKEPPT